jgi:hypothetical protein
MEDNRIYIVEKFDFSSGIEKTSQGWRYWDDEISDHNFYDTKKEIVEDIISWMTDSATAEPESGWASDLEVYKEYLKTL